MKKIWITSLVSSRDSTARLMATLKTYAIKGDGHFWEDDFEKAAWSGARGELIDPDTGL